MKKTLIALLVAITSTSALADMDSSIDARLTQAAWPVIEAGLIALNNSDEEVTTDEVVAIGTAVNSYKYNSLKTAKKKSMPMVPALKPAERNGTRTFSRKRPEK